MTGNPILFFFGHHKCATTWITSICTKVCRRLGLRFADVHNPNMFEHNLKVFVAENNIQFLAYTNARFEYLKDIDYFAGFHIIRDPRDILVSAYFSHLYSHSLEGWPELTDHRKNLHKVSKDRGLLLEMEFMERIQVFDDLYNWHYFQPNVMEIKMEDLIQSPYETIVAAFSFLRLVDGRCNIRSSASFLCSFLINTLLKRIPVFSTSRLKPGRLPVQELLGIVYSNSFSKKRRAAKQDRRILKVTIVKG